MFESIAATVSGVCGANPASVEAFEQFLFPHFQNVLMQDVIEFTPYVFQVRIKQQQQQ